MRGEAVAPVVQLKFVDAVDLFITWRWQDAPHDPRLVVAPRHLVQPALDAWARALPLPQPGETPEQAVRRALDGPLMDRAAEVNLSRELARALMPARLAGEVNEHLQAGRRPHLRIQASASVALVPWEALRVDEGERMVHICDVSALLPAAVRNAPGRRVSAAGSGAAVCVVDPGFRAVSSRPCFLP